MSPGSGAKGTEYKRAFGGVSPAGAPARIQASVPRRGGRTYRTTPRRLLTERAQGLVSDRLSGSAFRAACAAARLE